MTQPPFDSGITATVSLNDIGADLSEIRAGSYVHHTKAGTRETMMTLTIGRFTIQTADPNWFRHLIDKANAALICTGYQAWPPGANYDDDDEIQQEGSAA